jgi:hypothetical protein
VSGAGDNDASGTSTNLMMGLPGGISVRDLELPRGRPRCFDVLFSEYQAGRDDKSSLISCDVGEFNGVAAVSI